QRRRRLEPKEQIHVVHVGPRRTRDDQVAQAIEKRVRVVVGQIDQRVEAVLLSTPDRGAVDPCAGRVGRAVAAVGAQTGEQHVAYASQGQRGGEGQFLVAAAFTRSAYADGGFPASDQAARTGQRMSAGVDLA